MAVRRSLRGQEHAMGPFEHVDWHTVFVPDVPILEIFVRGTITYLALFTLLRAVLKRQSGNVAITDLLVIVLIADAAQNAMSSDYKSLPDGILLVGTIILWSFILDWLGYHVPTIGRFVHPPPLLLIRDGKLLRHNMRQELITKEELMSQLREQGIDDVARVKCAHIEGDGHLSVVSTDEKQHPKPTMTSA